MQETQPTQQNQVDQPNRTAELDAREARVAQRERALTAREALQRMQLPAQYLEHLDLHSDEALDKGLKLLAALRRETAAPQDIPKAHRESPADYARMDYRQRAALYQQDIDQYNRAFNQQ